MKKILITGNRGFIGSRLYPSLESEGFSVYPFAGDILKPEQFPRENFGIIVHLAALITHRGEHTEKELNDVNVGGTRNLLLNYHASKMVYISTTDVSRKELSAYAKTKLAAEELVLATNAANLVIRLPSVFGASQTQKDKLIPRLFRYYMNGEPCTIDNDDEREYVSIDEACRQITKSLDQTGVITVSGTRIRNNRLKEIIEAICLGKQAADMTPEEKALESQLKSLAIK